ncbi:MAG: formate--tetrahydrofolate ligase [Bacilli bacterium]
MTDLEIARKVIGDPISNLIKNLGIDEKYVSYYGKNKAKIASTFPINEEQGKLVLVTAINPTPYGEGKTTVSIGLADALHFLNKNPVLVLRQPSMGPVFGMKGGATGGGYSQVIPMDEINLHFTGDFHAITAANNLLSAAIDNHLKQGNVLNIDLKRIKFKRCLDVNDRVLREVQIGLGSKVNGPIRQDNFTITAASEIMALFCLATSLKDLKLRLGNIIIGYDIYGKAVFAKDLKIAGALTVLLKDAFSPNLVQTLEHTPTLIHGGPFANIAHGCNSAIATHLGLSLGDYVVTEAGFGADLGAEKFLDIKCQEASLKPNAIVLVVTIKALKYNAGVIKEDILLPNASKVQEGLPNLQVHMENLKQYGVPIVVCLNKYMQDTEEEIKVIKDFVATYNLPFSISTAYVDGGKGALDLANNVILAAEKENDYHPLYQKNKTIKEKIEIIAKNIYHASNIIYTDNALEEISRLEILKLDKKPICIAKTQYSISDDPKKLGYPKDYTITVKDICLYNGAGFITVLLGDIMTMPGLPKVPNYEAIEIDDNGNIVGIF